MRKIEDFKEMSTELRGQELPREIAKLLEDAAPHHEDLINCMVLACSTVAELRALESRTSGTPLAAPRAAAAFSMGETLLLRHEQLAIRLKERFADQASAQSASRSAGVLRPRFS